MLRAPALLVLLAAAHPACAGAEGLGAALRDSRWADADALAAAEPDPVARSLVLYYRLLSPGGGRPAEIASFMADHPAWPNQGLLSRRLAEALAVEPDDRTVLDICAHQTVQETPSLLRCAAADANAGRAPDAAETARQAWLSGITDPPGEAAFMKQWGKVVTPLDQWRRFDRLAWTDSGAVGGPAWRQLARLDAAQRPAAEARLALKRDDASARALVATLPGGAAVDPALMLELAKWLRRAGLDEEAQRLWLALGPAAEHATAPERRAAFWDERNLLARRRLRSGDPTGAYGIADGATDIAPAQAIEAEFLAGFIALRRLQDAAAATRHFRALAGLSHAAITQGRAYYWLGRAAAARGDAAQTHDAYAAAAAWPTTYYGQLAARALGENDAALAARIRAAHDPGWTPERALTFLGSEDARAAALLVAWGEPRRARSFILRLDDLAADGTDRTLAARLAVGFGLPDLAVAIARRAGGDGVMLAEAGWPMAVEPPHGPVEPALALGLIRQESNFNTEALSPVGARGLMQLMPGTAKAVAHRLGDPAVNIPALNTDPSYNMRLGTTYLGDLLQQFGGAIPYAVAGYNAGPGRVADWLASNGDPAAQPAVQPGQPGAATVDIIDWIELIPFSETRNYVQRVLENVVIYRALAGAVLPHPAGALAGMTLARLVASGGGVGFLPRAPGTWGSLLAVVLGAGLLVAGGRMLLAAGVALATVAGLWAIPRAGGEADPGWVVVDEVAGMWIAMLPLRWPSLWGLVVAFTLFRLLDIAKPGPIGRVDRLAGRVGVMGDDLLAGLAAAMVLWGLLALGLPGVRETAMLDDTTLQDAADLLERLRAAGLRLATAESCTGGLIAAALTHVAGSSDVVECGFVTYSNAAKTAMLGVPAAAMAQHGAVSAPVAAAMAEGALVHSQADIAVAVTGVAGPGGGSGEKPVGLVWFGLARRGQAVWTEHRVFPGDRAAIRAATVALALALLRPAHPHPGPLQEGEGEEQ